MALLKEDGNVFNIESIPIEVLDKSYEPYNLGITFRHPLRRIAESSDFKGKAEEAKQIMLKAYPLSDEQFIIIEGQNGKSAAILASLIENNVEIIEEAMLRLGFFRSKPNDDKLLDDIKGRKWIALRFEPDNVMDLETARKIILDDVMPLLKDRNEVNINGSRVYVDNGEVKIQYSEAIQESGYMTVEEAELLTQAAVKMIYELSGNL